MSDEKGHKIQLLGVLTRRKQLLELQVARLGATADPALTIEIEKLEGEIAKISSEVSMRENINPVIIEAWWNRKINVYMELLLHLANMQHYSSKRYSNEIGEEKINENYLLELNSSSNEAYQYIEKFVYIGDFIVTSDVIKSLQKLLQDLDKRDIEGNWMQDLEDHYSAIAECITKVREYAKADLLDG